MTGHRNDQAHRTWALWLNLIAPGAGLAILRREWLGLAAALLFALLAQVALWGLLVIPASIPTGLSVAAGVGAATVWLGAQRISRSRAQVVLGAKARQEIDLLSDRASEAMKHGRLADARDLLTLALAIDDEHLGLHLEWARLMTLTSELRAARRAWRRVIQLDTTGRHRSEAIAAMNQMSS